MIRAAIEVKVIMLTVGTADFTLNKLTPKEANAPTPICIAPMSAEAVPAFFEKGSKDRAEAFGLTKPRQQRKTKSNAVVSVKPSHPLILAVRKMRAVTVWMINAV